MVSIRYRQERRLPVPRQIHGRFPGQRTTREAELSALSLDRRQPQDADERCGQDAHGLGQEVGSGRGFAAVSGV